MIQANELRVGNLVTINETALHFDGAGKDETFCISEIKEEVVKFKGFHTSELYSGIEPIPLTEEWLLKFGFKPFCNDWSKKALIIHTRKRGFVIKRSIPIIKSVHQLQNLYFALTGTELTIK